MNGGMIWAGCQAALFDMDGVITRTASLHAAAWKQLFDQYLLKQVGGTEVFLPFDQQEDYRRYVDGKLREDGVISFLASRGIVLPVGSPEDTAESNTVAGLAKKKDAYFTALLHEKGVEVFEDGVALLGAVRAQGLQTGVVSASRHCKAVLTAAHLLSLFDVVVDGQESRRLNLKGKPDPAAFLEAARRLGVVPSQAMVLEDALAGVEAGRRGGFGLVVGVDRGHHAAALQAQGAHVVTSDLRSLLSAARHKPAAA
jgi:beta-phosphoglucomutase family hydrolase